MYQQFNNSKKNKIFFYNLLIITKNTVIFIQKLMKKRYRISWIDASAEIRYL